MQELNTVQQIAIWTLPVLFAITVHEVAHGWVAKQLGDKTAMMMGRLTLNPLKHIDPVGTIVVPLILLMLGGFIFGWAKPVPVTWSNLRQPKRDMALVAVAGPASNLIMAVLWALVIKLGLLLGNALPSAALPMILMGRAGIMINLVLMLVNLIPIPPLDGGRVLSGLLSGPLAWKLSRIEPYGIFIILILFVSGLFSYIIEPPFKVLASILYNFAQ